MRSVYLVLGIAFVVIGAIGVVLPVLPTTPFLIVAAACFSRSSPRFEAWLLAQPTLGPIIRKWRERGVIPWRAKMMALVGSSAGFVVFLFTVRPSGGLAFLVAALIVSAMAYVFSRPSV